MYEKLMRRGTRFMNLHLYRLAIKQYDAAYELAVSSREKACARQMQGIVYRLSKQFNRSQKAFISAIAIANAQFQPELSGRIQRDYGMLLLDRARHVKPGPIRKQVLTKADWAFTSSVDLLTRANKPLETAVTSGFIARGELLRGRLDFARARLLDADASLREGPNRDYELNNLMVALLAVEDDERPEVRRRIWKLIWQTGQLRRLLQWPLIEAKLAYDNAQGRR
jgi:hypothetical protein